MNRTPRSRGPVIEQSKLAALRNLRAAATELTLELKEMEAAGYDVEPGPLNFTRGKILLHSPAREPLPVRTYVESFELIAKLISPEDARAFNGHLIPFADWRKRRSALFARLLIHYRRDVLDIYAELVKRGRLTPAAAFRDRVLLSLWLAEIRLAGFGFSHGLIESGKLARVAARKILERLVDRGFDPEGLATA